MRAKSQSECARGVVLAHVPELASYPAEHEICSLLRFASELAALLGYDAGGMHDDATRRDGHHYFVPSATLTAAQAAQLGIHDAGDLFGGIVPHAFVATKNISHSLVRPDAAAVRGWTDRFAASVKEIVLAGHTVFHSEDARIAGGRLLARGPVRVKPARARAGHGQYVASDLRSLDTLLLAMDPDEIASHGLVLEEHLEELATFSAGQVCVGSMTASYFGTQRHTRNNFGEQVYGGSELSFVRGGFDILLADMAQPEARLAVAQAMRFHDAAHACFPGLCTSRANYDILLGRDLRGRTRSAVLEQSWRVGGATGAEIAALQVFRAQPARRRVRASCFEVFGESPPPPPDAILYFRDVDPSSGPLTKYTMVYPDDNAH